ncbi:MAG: DsbA family protein [Parvularculaceae bacterium]
MPSFPSRAALLALPLLLFACGGAPSEEAAASGESSETPKESIETGAMGDMTLGNPDAKVTVLEFASVTCPHCAAFHENIFPTIKEDYVDTGKVRFIFREFPTAPAGLSYVGSVLARCAADKGGQNAYFAVLDSLFKTQKTWIYGEDPKLELLKIAAQTGMNEEDFDACMQRQELVDLINRNVKEGSEKYNVNATPTFIVNGTKRAIRDAEEFSKILDEELEKSSG